VLAVRSAESHLYHPMTKLGARGRDTTCHSTADNPRSTQATIDQLLERRKHHEGEVLVAVENSGDVVCLVAGAEHLGIRLKLPFIAVRTGEVPVEPAMSAPSEPERDAPLLGFNSKHGRKIRDFGEAGVNALCRDACRPSGRRPGTGPEPFV
jgi:hypothetical protein